MEDSLAVHELDGPEDLEHVELDLLVVEGVALVLEGLVEVHVHQFEDEGKLACGRWGRYRWANRTGPRSA